MSLHDEIIEQPTVLKRLLKEEWDNIRTIAQELNEQDVHSIFLTARGTSDNAGLYAKYLFGIQNRIPVALSAPSIFSLYQSSPILHNSLVIGISQSGKSPDIVCVLEEGNNQGVPTLAITNTPDSLLAKAAKYVINIHAGEEKSVAATKSYTTQLTAIAMLSTAMQDDGTAFEDLQKIPEFINQILRIEPLIKEGIQSYFYMDKAIILGRGYNYATAYEWALKMKELCYVITEPYSTADFLHGPVAMIEDDFPVFVIATKGPVYKDTVEVIKQLRDQKKARLFVVSNHQDALALGDIPIPIPEDVPEWISPTVNIVVGQLFSYWLSYLKGLDTENPRGLSKVTMTF